jgi:hypothetical protein
MPIVYQKWITRADLRANPDKFYVFGDNVQRKGYGGQAKEMRGEPNAVGVATKWAPTMDEASFFQDNSACLMMISRELMQVDNLLLAGKTVVVPEDGIGTGLSQLPQRAPKIDAIIKEFFRERANS